MKINIANPQREIIKFKNFKNQLFSEVLSGRYVGGEQVEQFEENLKNFFQVKYATTLNSGTDALLLSLITLGIKENDEVIVPSFTYFATVETILQLKAKPIFVDVEKDSYVTSAKKIESLLTKKTKCIIPVHLFGYDCDIKNIKKLGQKYNIPIIEDTAQAFGSKSSSGKFLGTQGKINAFSNYPSKTLGGIGDGGFVLTNNKELNKSIRLLKNHGQKKQYEHIIPGFNSRLDSINAFVLLKKLEIFDEIYNLIKNFEEFYVKFFQNFDNIYFPSFNENILLNNFTIILPRQHRNNILKDLNQKGIEARIYYPIPIHKQKALSEKKVLYKNIDLSNSEKLSKSILSLPFYSFPTKKELAYLKTELTKSFKKFKIQ